MRPKDTGDCCLIAANELVTFCRDAFQAVGLPDGDAQLIAEILADADLRGVDSHGVVRLPIYIERLRRGAIATTPKIQIVRETRTTAVVDGGNGMGQTVSAFAMRTAIRKAQAEGEPAWVSVRQSNHFGAAAYYVKMACPFDMIGFACTIGGINHMVPWGGAEAILGNNPVAIGFPVPNQPPVVLDMACSVAARGKIIVAAKEGRPIPDGWAVDRDGVPTTNATKALEGFVTPMGGPKGYALALSIGLLSSMLSGAFFGSEVTHMYEDFANPQNIGHLFGVLPIAAFEDVKTYSVRIKKACHEVKSVRKASCVERIFLPGEREEILAEKRRDSGVPLPAAIMRELREVAGRLGIQSPWVNSV